MAEQVDEEEVRTLPSERVVDISDDRLMAAVCYIGVLVFLPLLTRKQDPYIHFHAKQGLVIFIGECIALVAGQWISVLGTLVFVLLLVASVIGFIQALQGRKFRIPGIAELADRFNI